MSLVALTVLVLGSSIPALESRSLTVLRDGDSMGRDMPILSPLGREPDLLQRLRQRELPRFELPVEPNAALRRFKLKGSFSGQYGEGTYLGSGAASLVVALRPAVTATGMLVPASSVTDHCETPPAPDGGPSPPCDGADASRPCASLRTHSHDICPQIGAGLGAAEVAAPWSCSVGLITSRRVITAAHCLRRFVGPSSEAYKPGDIDVVFGYDDSHGHQAVHQSRVSRILHCRHDAGSDIAVLELVNAAPVGSTPLLRRASPPAVDMPVHMSSHPAGLPVRVSTCIRFPADCVQAKVSDVEAHRFRAPLDSLKGSSGGIVVDGKGELVGVFHGGPAEPEPSADGCTTDLPLSDTCPGEWISRVDTLDARLFDPQSVLPEVTCEFVGAFSYGKPCTDSIAVHTAAGGN